MRHDRTRHALTVLLFLTTLLGGAALAAGPTIQVEPELLPVFDTLSGGYPGGPITPVDVGADLELREGTLEWQDTRSVAVLPGVLLSRLSDHPDAESFLNFARSPAGQRRLIDAGFLPATVVVTDQVGNTLSLPQPVERIASPYALGVYLPYALGAGDRITMAAFLGTRDPAGAAAMTRIDPRFPELSRFAPEETTSVEFLASIAPDLVFAAARSEWVPPVRALGIPVFAFEGESVEDLSEGMRLIGSILGPDAAARAEAWSQYYSHVLSSVSESLGSTDSRPQVLFTGTVRTRVATGAMYQTALIESAGGLSVTADLGGYWSDVGFEQVAVWDPDVVLVPQYGGASVEAILEDREWQLLAAVQRGEVHLVPKLVAPWDTPVPDSVLAIVWLAEVLHPETAALSCSDETRFFYQRFYDYEISEDEVTALCDL